MPLNIHLVKIERTERHWTLIQFAIITSAQNSSLSSTSTAEKSHSNSPIRKNYQVEKIRTRPKGEIFHGSACLVLTHASGISCTELILWYSREAERQKIKQTLDNANSHTVRSRLGYGKLQSRDLMGKRGLTVDIALDERSISRIASRKKNTTRPGLVSFLHKNYHDIVLLARKQILVFHICRTSYCMGDWISSYMQRKTYHGPPNIPAM